MSMGDLPNELFAMICETADKGSLMALRLTNKGTSVLATKYLATRFMTSFSVIMTAPCLERLIGVCEHPFFGPAIRDIYITSDHMMKHRIGNLESEPESLSESGEARCEENARAELLLQRSMERYNDEKALKKEGGPTTLLTRAFTALKTWSCDMGLYILPETKHDAAIFLYHDQGYYTQDYGTIYKSYCCLKSTVQPCLDAIRISKMNICRMEIESLGNISRKEFGQLNFNLKSFGKEDMRRFSMLRSITFRLASLTNYDTVQEVAAIISQARELEVLHLSHGHRSHKRFELGDNALQSVNSDRVNSLSLTGMSFSKQCLLDILNRHCNTLKTLRISCCVLQNGFWYEVISYMEASLPHLRTLDIERLYDFNGLYRFIGIRGFGEVMVEGEEKVKAVLQAMIKQPL